VRVTALGVVEGGDWLAVGQGDEELGYVVASALIPLIDGKIERPLKGTTELPDGGTCAYEIRFAGKGKVEGEPFTTADYDIDWRCARAGRTLVFPGFMFVTEAPYQMQEKPVYQISIDLLEVAVEYDEVFSTIFLWHRGDGRVVYDSVSKKALGSAPHVKELPARTVPEALAAAAAIAPNVWSQAVWRRLSGEEVDAPPPGEAMPETPERSEPRNGPGPEEGPAPQGGPEPAVPGGG
jgi:hypothetical protein